MPNARSYDELARRITDSYSELPCSPAGDRALRARAPDAMALSTGPEIAPRSASAAFGRDPIRQRARLHGLHRASACLSRAPGREVRDIPGAHRGVAPHRRRPGPRPAAARRQLDPGARAPARGPGPRAVCARQRTSSWRRTRFSSLPRSVRSPSPRISPTGSRNSSSGRSCSIRWAACCASRRA
jgi:hypothetical protein